MAGNKNSGRKSWEKEIAMRELWELSIPILRKALRCNDIKKISFETKVNIARDLFGKMIPKEIQTDALTKISNITYNIQNPQVLNKTERDLLNAGKRKRINA